MTTELQLVIIIIIIIIIITLWCRVLLEKLTGLQLVKKFPVFHGTRRFITALTSVHHLSLSWASPIQSIYPHPTSWRSILILSTHLHLGLPSGSFPPVSPARPYTPPSPHPYAPHAQPISFFSILSPAQYWMRIIIIIIIKLILRYIFCLILYSLTYHPDTIYYILYTYLRKDVRIRGYF